MARSLPVIFAILVSLTALLYNPLKLRADVLGVTRSSSSIKNIHGDELRTIDDTIHCEDLHLHKHSGLLFTACESDSKPRFSWFPGLANFKDASAVGQGSIYVINPKTFKSQRLSLAGFNGPFVTHGIEIFSFRNDPHTVYIYAVNHLPNPEHATNNKAPKARSQIELFRHTIGTREARYLRSVWHPLIRTPNDIYAVSPTEFYVTNDHYYREGALRSFEDVAWQSLAAWTDTIHVTISDPTAKDSAAGVTATVALKGLHNNNGLGHGKSDDEILIGRAAAGVLVLAQPRANHEIEIKESIQVPCTIDNPSYFEDPYAKDTGRDASGYVLAGLARACDLGKTERDPNGVDPVMVYLVRRTGEDGEWEKQLVFQDDGEAIRSASAAVLIAIDPAENGGKKQGWLFVTGFLSEAMVAAKIDL